MDRARTARSSAASAASTITGEAPVSEDAVDVLYEISQLVRTGLSRDQLKAAMALVDQGVSGEAVAAIIKELRREHSAPR